MHSFKGWDHVAKEIDTLLKDCPEEILDTGQRDSLRAIQNRLKTGQRALLLADEVGMGKTRIAAALIFAVKKSGGRTAVVLPPNVGKQWQSEMQVFDSDDKTLLPLRSYRTFIQAYAPEHSARTTARTEKNRKKRRQQARQMRDIPQDRWSDEQSLLISHNFANMQFHRRDSGHTWRRELLPAVAAFQSGSEKHVRQNWGDPTLVEATHQAAREIAQHRDLPTIEFSNLADMPSDAYRNQILPLIGRALGQFDLVIVDEAHKSRGQDSSLSRILGPITWVQSDGFRLGMTATPVELGADQWINTLARILGRDDAALPEQQQDIKTTLDELAKPIESYAAVVKRLQTEPIDETLVETFESDARKFEKALSPYVIRRDKRSDEFLARFREAHGDYREKTPIAVDPAGSSQGDTAWLRRFCAAEALSMLPQADRTSKVARLKLDKGLTYAFDLAAAPDSDPSAQFWLNQMTAEPDEIYHHPAIVKTVETIETLAHAGEKTLVFATLTKPIQALNHLLDARAMLKALADGTHWPATKVRATAEAAVIAAMAQLEWDGPHNIDAINTRLDRQYKSAHNKRSQRLAKIHTSLAPNSGSDAAVDILLHFWTRTQPDKRDRITEIIDAMRLIGHADSTLKTADSFMSAFQDLLKTLATAEDEEGTHPLPNTMIDRLEAHLNTFSSRESSFSRTMTGSTDPLTRYTLQEAFNRKNTWPMVLITQSLVGREGLDFHKDCRHVVLHAEWNPGVLEQQIGRVDRKGSKWIEDVQSWQDTGQNGPAPKIKIHTISVSGSYDQHQWDTVDERWKALRAQLHGDVVPNTHTSLDVDLAKRLQHAAPDFYPKMDQDEKKRANY